MKKMGIEITCEVPKWKEEANPPPAADYLAGNRPPMCGPKRTQKKKETMRK